MGVSGRVSLVTALLLVTGLLLSRLEAQGKLRGQGMSKISRVRVRTLKAVLQLQLSVCSETIAERSVDSPKVVSPPNASAGVIRNRVEELLVPAHGGE